MATPNPTSRPYLRQRAGGVYWYAKWSRSGTPVVRSLGPAWMEADGKGGWQRRQARATDGHLTEVQAHVQLLALVRSHDAEMTLVKQDAHERERRGVTFGEVALDYLEWLGDVKGAKPSTLRAVRSDLAEPGMRIHAAGRARHKGRITRALGDRPAREITTREINALLRGIAATGVAPRTVNKARRLSARSSTTASAQERGTSPIIPRAGRTTTRTGASPPPLLQRRAGRGTRARDGERRPPRPDGTGRRRG